MLSGEVIKSWKQKIYRDKYDQKYFSKFRKCQTPLVIGMEGVFIFTRKRAIIFLQAIVKGTFRALLTMGNKH